MRDTRKLEKAEWEDPANWRLLVFYVAPRDPRVIVPKRFARDRGYTLNLARPLSWFVLLPLALTVAAVVYAVAQDIRSR